MRFSGCVSIIDSSVPLSLAVQKVVASAVLYDPASRPPTVTPVNPARPATKRRGSMAEVIGVPAKDKKICRVCSG